MKKISILYSVLVIFAVTACKNGNSGDPSNYEQNKMSLEDQEKNSPLSFLSTDGTYRGTLFGSTRVINGTITNRATIATYKDVTLNVHFYSKTNTEISSGNYIVYDFFPPNQTKNFSLRIDVPNATNTIGWDIVSATPK